jgi:transglutaminase-like putative cysteine protease
MAPAGAADGVAAVKYRVRHLTTYSYTDPVQLSHHAAHLRPREQPGQVIGEVALSIRPEPAVLHDGRVDYFGNPITFFTIQDPHRKLEIEAGFTVGNGMQGMVPEGESPAWDAVGVDFVNYRRSSLEDVLDFVFASPQVPALVEAEEFARPSFAPGRPLVEAVFDLSSRIHADFTFDAAATTVGTPLATVFDKRRGVCQDFAHVGIACLRSMGLAARYVSGYIRTFAPPGKEKLVGADASHAWISVFLPGWGWFGIDPTNGCAAGTDHIVVAWGRDYDDVSPLRGVVLGGGDHQVSVAVDVVEIPAS